VSHDANVSKADWAKKNVVKKKTTLRETIIRHYTSKGPGSNKGRGSKATASCMRKAQRGIT